MAASVLVVVSLVAAGAWSTMRTYAERESEVGEQASEVAATAAAYLDEYFVSLDALASALVRIPSVVALNTEQSSALFADLLRSQPLLINIVLTAADGTVRASGLPSSGSPIDMDRNAFRDAAVKTGRPQVSELLTGQISGKPTIVLVYPVFGADGRVAGVVGLGVNLIQLQSVFARIPLPPGSLLSLVDNHGRVLARNVDAERSIGALVGVPSPGPQQRDEKDADGIVRVTAVAAVSRGPWTLSVGIPTSVVLGRMSRLWFRNLAIAGLLIVALMMVALFVAWQTTVQLGRLRQAMERIASGDLTPPTPRSMPNLELAQLQRGFIAMADNLQSLQKQVVRQERLAAVGVLVSGVAHELNNPLQAILGTAELLEMREGLGQDVVEDLQVVKTQSERARDIIRNLSRFSSQNPGPPSLVDLRRVVDEVVQLRHRELEALGIGLDVEAAHSRRRVRANLTELEQVTLNFVINAQQSIEQAAVSNGRILIRLFDHDGRIRLEVHDNGSGVPAGDEHKLFQPFFTTKPVGKGTGLGLSVSYGIIDSYGGSIGYFTNDWGGATFFFDLEAAEDDREAVLH